MAQPVEEPAEEALPALVEEPAADYGSASAKSAVAPVPMRQVPAAPVISTESLVPSVPRYFTCVEEGSSKFWEVVVNGTELTVRFGRIGTKGQSQTKSFTSADAALREQEKLIRSKVSKGYEEGAAT